MINVFYTKNSSFLQPITNLTKPGKQVKFFAQPVSNWVKIGKVTE